MASYIFRTMLENDSHPVIVPSSMRTEKRMTDSLSVTWCVTPWRTRKCYLHVHKPGPGLTYTRHPHYRTGRRETQILAADGKNLRGNQAPSNHMSRHDTSHLHMHFC